MEKLLGKNLAKDAFFIFSNDIFLHDHKSLPSNELLICFLVVLVKKKFLALEMVFETLHVHDNKMPKSMIYTVFHLLKVSLSTNPSFYHGLMQQQRLEDIVV